MLSNKGGVTFALIIIVVVAMAFGYVLTSPTGGGLQPSSAPTKYTQYFNLGADAAGWQLNDNASNTNPVLNVLVSTMVYFNVTEIDGAPHNLYLGYDGAYSASLYAKLQGERVSSPKSIEPNSNYQILSLSDITQTIGHKTQGHYPFQKAGIYTYWCSVHYLTMVGLLIVNASSGTSSAIVTGIHASSVPNGSNSTVITYSANTFNYLFNLKASDLVE